MISFLLSFFKTKAQLQLEIIFLRKQLEIHVIVMNENHLRRLLKEYFHYYNFQRTHLGLDKDSPVSRPAQVIGKIGKVPVANGLHNYYFREAA
jgi:transposase InsO family protein